MKKTRALKWITAVCTGLLFLFALLIPTGGGIFGFGKSESTEPTLAEAASVVQRPSGATFGQFPNGYTYVYTDKTEATKFRAGSVTTDLKTQTTSSGSVHGSAENPFVIETVSDWENFAKHVSVATGTNARGANQVFVLAKDIDFTGATFRFVPYFNGRFHAMGHTLSNISATAWQYWKPSSTGSYTSGTWTNVGNSTNAGFGLFGLATGATITDLILENFSYKSIPAATAFTTNWGDYLGGVIGVSQNATSIMNCHVQGVVVGGTFNNYAWSGGLIGIQHGTGGFIYRCSADTDFTVNCTSSFHTHHGGLIGDVYMSGSAVMYDCVSNTKITAGGNNPNIGGILGYLREKATLTIENVVAYIQYGTMSNTANTSKTAIMGMNSSGSRTAKNIWSNLYYGSNGTSSLVYQNGSGTFTNLTVGPYITGTPSGTSVKSTRDAVVTAARDAVGSTLSANIWDKTRFSTTAGMGTFTPDKTPLRNYLTQIPHDVELEYTGEALDITGADWYLDNVHGNPDIMEISYPTGGMINANVNGYNVTFNLKPEFTWNDGSTGSKTIKVIVKPKKLSISWDSSNGAAVAKISGGLANRDLANPPEITNTYYKDGVELDGLPQTVGTYTVKATIEAGGNYKLKDNETDADPEFTFNLTAIPIATPTLSGETEKTYNGKDLEFWLADSVAMSEGKILAITQEDMPAGATYTETVENGITRRKITVKDAGTYKISFTLKDPENTCWSDGAGTLTITVKKRPLNLELGREDGKIWEFETNTQEQFTITHDAVDGDNIALAISYVKPDETTVTLGADKLKTEGKKTTVTLDPWDRGTYKIIAGIASKAASNDNGNYTLVAVKEQEVKVNGKAISITRDDIHWRYSDGQSLNDLTDDMEIPYTGRTITASIDTRNLAEKGVRIDSYTNETGLNVTADFVETTVFLTKLNESYEFDGASFKIRWKIVQAKFDLTNVKWDYSGPIGYTGSWITVKLMNVPNDLTVTYTGNRQQKVTGTPYTADVTFTCSNPNYIVPKNGDTKTYIFNGEEGTDFPWTLSWKIKRGVIETNWDFYAASYTDQEDHTFNYPTLIGGKDRVDYKFYTAELKEGGGWEPGEEIALGEILVIPGTEVNYFAEAILKNDAFTNFELSEGNNPIRFTIGENKTPVTVTITQNGGVYNGEAKAVDFIFDVIETAIPLRKSDFKITYFDENGIALAGAPTNAGNYKVQFVIAGDPADDYYVSGKSTFDFTIEKFVIDISGVEWDYTEAFVFTREKGADKLFKVTLKGMPASANVTYTRNEYSAVGKYKATAELGEDIDTDNIDFSVFWNDAAKEYKLPDNLASLDWEIKTRELKVPKPIVTGLTYDGNPRDLIALCELDEDWEEYMTVSVKKGVETVTGTSVTDAGTYVVVCTVLGSLHNSVIWANKQTVDQSSSIVISPRILKVTGWQGKPSLPLFDSSASPDMYAVVYKDTSDSIVANPADGLHYGQRIRATVEVPERMTGNVIIVYDEEIKNYDEFIIFDPSEAPKLLKKPELVKAELEYNFEEQTFVIKNWRDYKEWIDVIGNLTVESDFIGTKKVQVKLKNDKNVLWDDTTSDLFEIEFKIVRGQIAEKWDKTQTPPVLSFEGMDVLFDLESMIVYDFYDMDGSPVNPNRLKEGERYEVVARLKDEYADKFGFGSELLTETPFEFVFGQTDDPNLPIGPDTPINPPSDNTVGELPLWQLIVGGVSAVLFLICASKSFGEYGKLKAAKKEAKELAQMSYAVTYGVAPLPLLAVSFLGAGETTWTIVACVLAGLFVLSLAALMILSKKRKAAELVVRREKARIEEEKEYARQEEQLRREEQLREEQQRRDDQLREEQMRRDQEFKMMFAAMQQGFQQQPMQYDDMRSLLAETVSALLPAMQQQMAALPPAQSDPNAYAAPVYSAPAPAAPSSETEELRAQIAQQQEMINRLMNQQAAPAAPAYEAYDEVAAAQDVAFWMDDSDEIVSLEELYGRLSDDAKRCYYEIGSYIMGKPQTSQNDGKYAVLFKYRGKTLFKLCIKEDAPVLYYATDGGVKECVRITDAGTLDAARKIVDMRIMKVDGQM